MNTFRLDMDKPAESSGWLRHAELVVLRVPHHPPVTGRPLVHFPDAGRTELFQPGDQRVEAAGLAVDVHVQAVLADLALGHILEEQSSTSADTSGLIERILGVADRRVAAEDPAATVLGDRFLTEAAGGPAAAR